MCICYRHTPCKGLIDNDHHRPHWHMSTIVQPACSIFKSRQYIQSVQHVCVPRPVIEYKSIGTGRCDLPLAVLASRSTCTQKPLSLYCMQVPALPPRRYIHLPYHCYKSSLRDYEEASATYVAGSATASASHELSLYTISASFSSTAAIETTSVEYSIIIPCCPNPPWKDMPEEWWTYTRSEPSIHEKVCQTRRQSMTVAHDYIILCQHRRMQWGGRFQ